jgi:coronin-1B/1C/6
MNASKFKNALGEIKKEHFTNCNATTVSTEGRYLAVNGNFLALSWSNQGEIVVVDSSSFCSIKPDQPRIKGRRANVLDLEFSPHSSDLLAAAFDDCIVSLYKIPEGGLKEHLTQEVQIYQKHMKKVPFVTFNPVASNVVCSGAFLGDIHVWNALTGDSYVELKADETPTCVQWSPNGTLIGATTKKKTINIFDPRANKLIMNNVINEQFQASKFAWLDNEQFVTLGWTKAKAKMMRLWDIRKIKDDLSAESEVTSIKIDSSSTVTTPYVDRESKLVYAIAKGEAMIRTFDYSSGHFVKGIDFSSGEPSISTVMFERKCLDYNKLEVDRFARYVNSHKVFYVSYTIARRNPGYDPTLYPPVECGEAALTYEQWIGGETAEPIKKEINTIENKFVSKVENFVKKEVKVEAKSPDAKVKELEGKIAEMSVKINQLTEENAKLRKQIEAKKAQNQQQAQVQEEQPQEQTNQVVQEEQPQEEQQPQEEPPQEEQTPEEQPQEQTNEIVQEEQPPEEQPPEEQPPEEQAQEEQPMEIQMQVEEQPPEEQAQEQQAEEQPPEEQPPEEQPPEEQAQEQPQEEEQPPEEQPQQIELNEENNPEENQE